jgi:hypothetical protein
MPKHHQLTALDVSTISRITTALGRGEGLDVPGLRCLPSALRGCPKDLVIAMLADRLIESEEIQKRCVVGALMFNVTCTIRVSDNDSQEQRVLLETVEWMPARVRHRSRIASLSRKRDEARSQGLPFIVVLMKGSATQRDAANEEAFLLGLKQAGIDVVYLDGTSQRGTVADPEAQLHAQKGAVEGLSIGLRKGWAVARETPPGRLWLLPQRVKFMALASLLLTWAKQHRGAVAPQTFATHELRTLVTELIGRALSGLLSGWLRSEGILVTTRTTGNHVADVEELAQMFFKDPQQAFSSFIGLLNSECPEPVEADRELAASTEVREAIIEACLRYNLSAIAMRDILEAAGETL